MSFISFNLDFYKTELQKVETAAASGETIYRAKQLLKMLLFPNTGLAVGAFLFSVLLGIGPGMYPAAKASGLMTVEALRSE